MQKQTGKKKVTLGKLTIFDSRRIPVFSDATKGKVWALRLHNNTFFRGAWQKICDRYRAFFVTHQSVSGQDIEKLIIKHPRIMRCAGATHIKNFKTGEKCDVLIGDPVSLKNLLILAGGDNPVYLNPAEAHLVFQVNAHIYLFWSVQVQDNKVYLLEQKCKR